MKKTYLTILIVLYFSPSSKTEFWNEIVNDIGKS